MENIDIKKPTRIEITQSCYVNGEIKKPGDTVTLSGNDLVQLLSSGRGKVPEAKTGK